jgi:tryptophanyl-tRNA synthetase
MSTGQPPEVIAAEIGDGGSGRLKARLTEALNNYLAPLRARRTELAKDPVYVAGVLRRGIERANAEAESTIIAVRRAMGMVYET